MLCKRNREMNTEWERERVRVLLIGYLRWLENAQTITRNNAYTRFTIFCELIYCFSLLTWPYIQCFCLPFLHIGRLLILLWNWYKISIPPDNMHGIYIHIQYHRKKHTKPRTHMMMTKGSYSAALSRNLIHFNL